MAIPRYTDLWSYGDNQWVYQRYSPYYNGNYGNCHLGPFGNTFEHSNSGQLKETIKYLRKSAKQKIVECLEFLDKAEALEKHYKEHYGA